MGLELRNPNWKSVVVTAPSGGYSAGDMVAVNSLIGVIVEDAAATKDAVLIYSAERIEVPKSAGSGIVFDIGDKVYYNATAKAVTNSAAGNTLCGRAKEATNATATTLVMDLTGNIVA